MKNFKRIGIIILIILCITSISFATYLLTATQVSYDKNGATVTVKDALDELYAGAANIPKKVFSQGQLVRYKGEEFYSLYDVYNDVSNTDTTMEIFAKTNIDPSTCISQINVVYDDATTPTSCKFSSSMYWDSVWTSGTRLNLNNVNGYVEDDAIGKARKYARLKGAISGRLLTYEEVVNLTGSTYWEKSTDISPTIKSMINGEGNTVQNFENYWLGSSDSGGNVGIPCVMGNASSFWCQSYDYIYRYGVRPVLTVYKSDVTPVS